MPTYTASDDTLDFNYDIFDGGLYKITNTVKVHASPDQPIARRVYLLDGVSKRKLRSTFSDPVTGVYTFLNIAGGRKYDVISYDYNTSYRAVIADNLTPEPM